MKTLLTIFVFGCSAIASAQTPKACSVGAANANRYLAVKETVLSGGAEKVTVQQPTGASNQVSFECVDVYCSVACEIFFYQNGAAATTTTLAPVALNTSQNPSAVAFSASNVGGSAYKAYYLPAAGTMAFDASNLFLPRNASGNANFSVGIGSISGTVRIQIQWVEN